MKKVIRIYPIVLAYTLCLLVTQVAAVANVIGQGQMVFIGEEGLDVSAAVPDGYFQVAWFAPGTNPSVDVPANVQSIGDKFNFYVSPSQYLGETGAWYLWNRTVGPIAFYVQVPNIAVRIWDQNSGTDVTDKVITVGDYANFRIDTNLVPITTRSGYNPATDGPITIKVTAPSGATYNALVGANGVQRGLTNLNVNANPWYWVPVGTQDGWNTAAIDADGARVYAPGSYTVTLDYNVNHMQDNDVGVPGIPVPIADTVTFGTGTVSMAGPSGSVVRGTRFTSTINGLPNTDYFLWVKGTGTMTGTSGDQPPLLTASQVGVAEDPVGGPYTIGSYQFSGGSGRTIRDDVPPAPAAGTGYYALVTTDTGGSRTVEWTTSQDTNDRTYDIHVERMTGTSVQSDDVNVRIIKGAVTAVVGGSSSAFIGEEVDLSGTNSETDTVYLFITGPNLPSSGGRLDNPRVPVRDGDPSSFTSATVQSDNTWLYRWQTADIGIDAGTYTVFAEATPRSRDNLGNTDYGTTTVILSVPLVSGGTSTPVVAQGDVLHITGVATGDPASGVAVWIFGNNLFIYDIASVNQDNTFDYQINRGTTSNLAPGQYFVVVQHPGYDGTFEVYPDPTRTEVLGVHPVPNSVLFRVSGPGALEGPDAANALVTELNSQAIDDTYTSLSFLVESSQIDISPIATTTIGSVLTVSGTTDLAPGDHLLVELFSSQFGPTPKTQPGAFAGASGTVTVQAGQGGLNTWSFPVDTTTLTPDDYVVIVSGVEVTASASTTFTLVPVLPTTAQTTPQLTPSPTPVITTPATTQATTPATTTPGFEAWIGLSGLLATVSLMRARKKRGN